MNLRWVRAVGTGRDEGVGLEVDYQQILRRRAEGAGQRGIADALGRSLNTVAAVFASATTSEVVFAELAELGADDRKLLLADPSVPVPPNRATAAQRATEQPLTHQRKTGSRRA